MCVGVNGHLSFQNLSSSQMLLEAICSQQRYNTRLTVAYSSGSQSGEQAALGGRGLGGQSHCGVVLMTRGKYGVELN